jgi:hypothetical protein
MTHFRWSFHRGIHSKRGTFLSAKCESNNHSKRARVAMAAVASSLWTLLVHGPTNFHDYFFFHTQLRSNIFLAKAGYIQLSLRSAYTALEATTGGHHNRVFSRNYEGFSLTISSSNPVEAPIVTYEYLFCPPLSDRLHSPARRRAQGLLSGSSTPGITGHWLQLKILDTAGSLQR